MQTDIRLPSFQTIARNLQINNSCPTQLWSSAPLIRYTTHAMCINVFPMTIDYTINSALHYTCWFRIAETGNVLRYIPFAFGGCPNEGRRHDFWDNSQGRSVKGMDRVSWETLYSVIRARLWATLLDLARASERSLIFQGITFSRFNDSIAWAFLGFSTLPVKKRQFDIHENSEAVLS